MACVMAAIQGRFVQSVPHSEYADNSAMMIWVLRAEFLNRMLPAAQCCTSLRLMDAGSIVRTPTANSWQCTTRNRS